MSRPNSRLLFASVLLGAVGVGCNGGGSTNPSPPSSTVKLELTNVDLKHPAGPLSVRGDSKVTCREFGDNLQNSCLVRETPTAPAVAIQHGETRSFSGPRAFYLNCGIQPTGCRIEIEVDRFRRVSGTGNPPQVIALNEEAFVVEASMLPAELTCNYTSQCPSQPSPSPRCRVVAGGTQHYMYQGGINNAGLTKPSLVIEEAGPVTLSCGNTAGCRCGYSLNTLANTEMSIEVARTLRKDCPARCQGPNPDLYCQKITRQSNEFEELFAKLVSDSDGRLEKDELMDIFDIPCDPCQRGDVWLVDRRLSNFGERGCRNTFEFDLGGQQLEIAFDVARTLSGTIEELGPGVDIVFEDLDTAPVVQALGDSDFAREVNEAAAGSVLAIQSDGTRAWIETDKPAGCWEVTYAP